MKGHEVQCGRRRFEHRRKAAHHEHARGDHRRGMDQRRHWGRPLHRVGQPGVQPELRRFAHRADEQQQAQHRHRIEAITEEPDRAPCHARRRRQDFGDRDGVEHQIRPENPEHEAKIADAVDDERLDRGSVRARLAEPEADQQIASEADAFPAEEHLDQVIRGDEHQHRKGEQRQIGEEPRLIGILLHIAPAIKMDERRDARDHHQHHRGQRIDTQCPGNVHRPRLDEVENRGDTRGRGTHQIADEDRPAQRATDEERAGRDQLRRNKADRFVAEPRNRCGQQRQKDDDRDQPFIPSSG